MSLTLFFSCDTNEQKSSHFRLVPSEESNLKFINSVENQENFNIFSYRNFYNGGGVGIGDINNDGLPDVYFTHNTDANRLFLNEGNLKFKDITEAAGVAGKKAWSTGVAMVDINSDGLLDIYVCNAGFVQGDDQENELFINQGDGTFTEEAAKYGLNENGYTTHAAFFDYDLDGDLDAYILNNSFIPVNTLNYSDQRELNASDWPVRDFLKGGGDKLLRNDEGKFVDVTEESGIYSSLIGFGLGITVGDVNGDAWPDMYISNDFFERDYLYINQQDGTFSEEIRDWMQHISLSSMGADMADINNDGFPEIFVTDMLPDDEKRLRTTASFENYAVYELKLERDFYHQYMHNTLQLNNQNGTFSEISQFSGVAASDWSWGALMFDMDNDGYRDLYVSNGIYHDVTNQDFIDFFANEVIQQMTLTGQKEEVDSVIAKMPSTPIPNKTFHNQGNLKFADVSEEWGLTTPSFSNGSAYADLDLDGDLDLIVNNLFADAFLYENQADKNADHQFLQLQLIGDQENIFAIGSKAFLHTDRGIISNELIPTRGFQSSVDYRLHFGLTGISSLDSLVIVWPDRSSSVMTDLVADTLMVINKTEVVVKSHSESRSFFSPILAAIGPNDHPIESHKEDAFVDFYFEGLISKKLSNEGPAMAKADLNADGYEDLFVGAAVGDTAQIYFGTADGLKKHKSNQFDRYAEFEDVTAIFSDLDGDGDPDLVIGSGGNHTQVGTRSMQDRVYMNDGRGEFELNPNALPNNGFNTSVIRSHDFDADGDNDLFIGSRSVPLNYGVAPRSYIYVNDGTGKFSDKTKDIAPDLSNIGLVTDAMFADLTGEAQKELVVIGEWMAPHIFQWQNGQFRLIKSNLSNHSGWWYAIEAEDLNDDGRTDLILGNRGENFYFDASNQTPAKLWVNDFDDNGTVENIITRVVGGKDMTVAMKKELVDQLVILKKANVTHEEFAPKSMQELFDRNQIESSKVLTANDFQSYVAINQGNGSFDLKPLPVETQLSCICDIYCSDLNGDQIPDLLLAGNDFGFAPQFSRLDASSGHLLLGNGDGTFQSVRQNKEGFFVQEQVKQLLPIEMGEEEYVIAAINNDKPKIFKVQRADQ